MNAGTSGSPGILLTGPGRDLEDWVEAAGDAGWRACAHPLVETVDTGLDLVEGIDGLPDWICVTSSNALDALGRATQRMPELLTVPFACVGTRTEERARSLGFKLGLEAQPDASSLAGALEDVLPTAGSILWPRGSLSSWLGDELEAAGHRVLAPVVYETRVLESGALRIEGEDARAIFLASPSAVRAYADRIRAGEHAIPLSIAIGPTTAQALDEYATILEDVGVLEQPTPEALAAFLRAIPSPRHDP